MMRAFLTGTCLLLAVTPAFAQNRPSFDCAKAKEEVERAICKDSALSGLDRDIASAYAAARRKLDPEAQKAFQLDQESFLLGRDAALESPNITLREHMAFRLEFLRSVRSAPTGSETTAFLGEWKAEGGSVKITRGKAGQLQIEINTNAPVTARWICEVGGEARLRDGKLRFKEDDVEIILSRKGQSLNVEEIVPASHGRDYCGANGSVEGAYFRVK
jgi:uncharacterized protein